MRLESFHKRNLVKAKKIIVDSIKDHLIPQVSSLKTPKEMFGSFSREEHKSEDEFEKPVEEC